MALLGVAELVDAGRAANSAGRPTEGERWLRHALAVLGAAGPDEITDTPSVAPGTGQATVGEARVRALLSLSTSLVEKNGPGVALRTAQEALAAAADAPEDARPPLVAMCHSQLAMLHGRAGRTRLALTELGQAVELLDALGPRERIVVLLSRGLLRLDQPDPVGAAADFTLAADVAAEHSMARQEFMARHNLGLAAALAGDLPGALSLMIEADRLPVDVSRAAAWHGRARVLMEAGLVTEAAELLERAAGAALHDGLELEAGESMADLAHARLLLGDAAGALGTARAAGRSLSRRLAPGMRRHADLVQLAARLRTGEGLAGVARRAAELAVAFDADGDAVAADLARLVAAEAHSRRGRHAEALAQLDRSADLARVGSLSTRMRTRAVLAAAARAQDEATVARRHVRAARQDLTRALRSSTSLELRTATTLQAAELARLDLSLARPRPLDRLAAADRWRETVGQLPTVRPPSDPDLARRVAVLRHLRQRVREEPARAGRLRERLRSLERQVAAASWASTSRVSGQAAAPGPRDGAASERTTLARARDELGQRDASAVYLLEDDGHLGAIVVSAGARTREVDLGPVDATTGLARRLAADLAARASVSGGPMLEPVSAALTSSLAAIDALVLRPLGVDGRAVVVPTAPLAGLPWGLLPSRHGIPTTVAPSLATWVRGVARVAEPQAAVLAGPGLEHAPEECASVAGVWETGAPAGTARAADLAGALSSADLVHVAAHGSHRSDSPLFSSVWLGDGPTFLADLERVGRAASHVVVSACDGAAGATPGAGGTGAGATLGLASGLIALGVGSVVASPCRVPDVTAADLMPRYHRRLVAGVEVDEALAEAVAACDLPLAGAFVAWGSPWAAVPEVRSPVPH